MTAPPKPQHANAIVVCCDPNYLAYAATTLLTCHEQGASRVADLHLICYAASAENMAALEQFKALHSVPIIGQSVALPPDAKRLEANHYGPGTLLRLFVEEWISPDYARVLHVDSDILALGPVAPIFDIALGGKAFAAVPDWCSLEMLDGKAHEAAHIRQLGMDLRHGYFNAGVMMMDWKQIVGEKRFKKCIETGVQFREKGIQQKFADQDILNAAFEGDWQPMDIKYNLVGGYAALFGVAPVFRHFAGGFKPWGPMLNPHSMRYIGIYRRAMKGSRWPVPGPLRFVKDTPWSFEDYYFNMFKLALKRKLRPQLIVAG